MIDTIVTTSMKEEDLSKTPTDVYCKPLSEGDKICYNYQGELRKGTVENIKKWKIKQSRPSWYHLDTEVHVRMFGSNHISKIKNPRGIIIL